MVSLWARRSAVMGTANVMSVPGAVKPDPDGSWLDCARWDGTDRGRASGLVLYRSQASPSLCAVPITAIPGHGRDTLHVRSIQHARGASGVAQFATMRATLLAGSSTDG